ncbi:hypothetical protein Pst134EB_001424 [Puccinia striiformis f. sp. tritici]|nr:hypothetical protein Pst134EB_001424 [Puccinia striiformis f. sp. tritici]
MELITLARSRRPTTMQCAKALCTNHFTMVILILLVVLISSSEAQRLCADSSPPSPGCICYPGQTNAPDCNRLACGNRQFSPLAQSTYLHAKKKLTENQITRFTEPASTTPYRLQVYQNSTSRAAFDPIIAGASGNLGCGEQCTSGFAGSTCNICQNTDSCQKGISSASSSGLPGLGSATTGDVICSKEPIAYTANFGQCLIDNPMIKSLLPGKLEASIQRYPDPTSASLPTSSIAGLAAGSTTVTLLYAPNTTAPLQDQFTCQANNCTQQVKDKVYSMSCQSLKCKCNSGSFLCGGGVIDLTTTISTITGDVGMDCPLENNSTTSATPAPCHIKMGLLKNIFGPQGFSLTNCQFGECVSKRLTESKRSELIDGDKSSISGGLIAGLVIVALIIAAFFGLVAFGFYRQRLARKTTGTPYSQTSAAARVEWSNLRYHLPMKSGAGSILRRRKAPPASTADLEAIQSPTSKSSHSSHGPNPLSYGPQILCGLSGSVEAGTMMAILGPSGAGKSTFLDVLAGQQKVGLVSGRRHISLPGEPDEPIVVGFVDQSDILPPTSTVREALMFSARLKLPEHVSYDERERRVSEVIDLLGLSKVVDSRIGDEEKRGLSGGERRRLSIGLELIARPSVLFLDEPTSGLDSVSALRVVKVLKGLSTGAENGHGTTIICSIHQPNSQIYHAFDYVCLLAPGGRQIYCGPTSEAVNYLGSRGLQCPAEFNPADFLLEVASEPPVGFLDQCTEPDQMKCETSKEEHSVQFPPPPPTRTMGKFGEPTATMITQLQVISYREWLCLKRDPSLFWFLNILSTIIGVFVGVMFFQVNLKISGFQNRVGSLFFTCAIFVFSSLSALTNFYRVRVLFMRERAAGFYSPTAWLIVRALFDVIPLRVLPMLTMGTIIYWMVGLASEGTRFIKYLLILLELGLVQTMFNMWLGASIRNLGTAVFLASMINLLQLGFAGFFVNLTSMTKVLRWVQYVIPLKFALEAMTTNEVSAGLMIDDNLQGINVKVSASLIMNLLFGFKEDAYWRNVIILFGFFLFLASLLILTVIRKLRQVK